MMTSVFFFAIVVTACIVYRIVMSPIRMSRLAVCQLVGHTMMAVSLVSAFVWLATLIIVWDETIVASHGVALFGVTLALLLWVSGPGVECIYYGVKDVCRVIRWK